MHHLIGAGNHNKMWLSKAIFPRRWVPLILWCAGELGIGTERAEQPRHQLRWSALPRQLCSMILTGSEGVHWNVSQVRVEGNGGWNTQLLHLPLRMLPRSCGINSQSHLDTFVDAAVPQVPVYRLHQPSSSGGNQIASWKPFQACQVQICSHSDDILGEERYTWVLPAGNERVAAQ